MPGKRKTSRSSARSAAVFCGLCDLCEKALSNQSPGEWRAETSDWSSPLITWSPEGRQESTASLAAGEFTPLNACGNRETGYLGREEGKLGESERAGLEWG